jgi:hypothetical protein
MQANVEDYSDIILAFPIWAGTFPPAIGAFLKQYPFQGKNIRIIACSGGGNAEKAFAAIYFKEMIALHICDNMQNIFLHTNKLCPEKQNLFRRVYLSYKAFPYFILNYLLTSHLYLFLVYTFCYISSSVFC